MEVRQKDTKGIAFRACAKLIVLLLPMAALATGVNTYLATRVIRTREDSLKMSQEAEDNVMQLEAVLDGTPQGWQKLMLIAKKIYDIGSIATPALLRLASSKKADPMFRKMAIEIICDFKDPRATVPFAKIARDTTNPAGVRDEAVYGLGHMGTPEALDSLLAFLNSEEVLLKEGALSGIRAFPSGKEVARAFDITASLAVSSEHPGVRDRAILALSTFGDQAIPLLSELVRNEDKRVRAKAIHGLSGSGCSSAVPPLAKLLSSDDQRLRTSIIFALQDLGDPAAVPALVSLLDKGGYDASNAAQALATIGDKRALEPLRKTIEHTRAQGKEPSIQVLNAYNRLTGEPLRDH